MVFPRRSMVALGSANFGSCKPRQHIGAGNLGGMENPAPPRCPAAFLESGSQRVSRSLSPQQTSPRDCQGQYLSPCGAMFNSVVTTSSGHLSAIFRSRELKQC